MHRRPYQCSQREIIKEVGEDLPDVGVSIPTHMENLSFKLEPIYSTSATWNSSFAHAIHWAGHRFKTTKLAALVFHTHTPLDDHCCTRQRHQRMSLKCSSSFCMSSIKPGNLTIGGGHFSLSTTKISPLTIDFSIFNLLLLDGVSYTRSHRWSLLDRIRHQRLEDIISQPPNHRKFKCSQTHFRRHSS